MMQIFRSGFVKKTLIAGMLVTFVNLSFLQAEVYLLGLNDIPGMSFLLAFAAAEEEAESEEATDKDPAAKEVDFLLHNHILDHTSWFLLSHKSKRASNDELNHNPFNEVFCPPPEI